MDAVVRNGNILLNVGPDRHGKIPETHAALLRHFGAWLAVVGDSIYGTRGGPWNPVDGQYGFTYKPGKYFVHILPDYQGTEFLGIGQYPVHAAVKLNVPLSVLAS